MFADMPQRILPSFHSQRIIKPLGEVNETLIVESSVDFFQVEEALRSLFSVHINSFHVWMKA
jgi:hypothetical protein